MADKYLWNIGGADTYLWKIGSKGGEVELPIGFQAVISEDETVSLIDQTGLSDDTVEAIKSAAGGRAIAKDGDESGTPVFVTEENGQYSVWDQGVYAARINSQLTSNTVSVLKYDLKRVECDAFYCQEKYDGGTALIVSGVWPSIYGGQLPVTYYESAYVQATDTVIFNWGEGISEDSKKYEMVTLTRVSGEKGSAVGTFALEDESGTAELTVEFTDVACVKWVLPEEESEIGTASFVIDGCSEDGYVTSAHGFAGMKVYYHSQPKVGKASENNGANDKNSLNTKTVSNMVLEDTGDVPNSWRATIEFDDGTTDEGAVYNENGDYGSCTLQTAGSYVGEILSGPTAPDIQDAFRYLCHKVVISQEWSLVGSVKMVKGGAEYTLGGNQSSNVIALSKNGEQQSSVSLKTINGTTVIGGGDIETSSVTWIDY